MVFNFAEFLENLAKRPWMHMHPVTFATVQSYLRGLSVGCRLGGIEYSWEEYTAAAEARGWDPHGSIGILRAFKRKELSDEEMVRELLAVEVDAYRRALERIKSWK